MPDFTISVDYSNAYSAKKVVFPKNYVKVNVNSATTVGQIKKSVLKYLNVPYDDLYFLESKDRKFEDANTVLELGLSEKNVLVLRCKDVDGLYNRMRKDRRM